MLGRRGCSQKSVLKIYHGFMTLHRYSVKCEVHVSSVWQYGNVAAEASAKSFLSTVFKCFMQLSHRPQLHKTPAGSSRAPAGLSLQDHFWKHSETGILCPALPEPLPAGGRRSLS